MGSDNTNANEAAQADIDAITNSSMFHLTGRPALYFDGRCPICRREIAHYQRLDRKQNRICWIDLIQKPNALEPFGISFEEAMRQIYATDSSRKLYRGIDAFILIWYNLPYYRIFAKIASTTPFYSFLNWCYQHFSAWRFKRVKISRKELFCSCK